MKVVMRADASDLIGVGHVMRCVSLGIRLKSEGKRIHFISAEINDWLISWLQELDFGFSHLPIECVRNTQLDAQLSALIVENLEECTWVVVDHYGLDSDWETVIKDKNKRIMVIDDVGRRAHSCNVLLDTSLRSTDIDDYSGRLLSKTLVLSGPSYVILRPEFDNPSLVRFRSGEISKILIYFGGGNIDDELRKVTSAIRRSTTKNLEVTVVLGKTQTHQELIDDLSSIYSTIKIIDNSSDMANLIKEADLAIGTCGISAWERCALGLPALTVITADNQRDDALHLDSLGVLKNLGEASEVEESTWLMEISNLLNNPTEVSKISKACLNLNLARRDSQKRLIEIFDQ